MIALVSIGFLDLRPGDVDWFAGAGTGTRKKAAAPAAGFTGLRYLGGSVVASAMATLLTTSRLVLSLLIGAPGWRWPSGPGRYGTSKSPVRVAKRSPDRTVTDSASEPRLHTSVWHGVAAQGVYGLLAPRVVLYRLLSFRTPDSARDPASCRA